MIVVKKLLPVLLATVMTLAITVPSFAGATGDVTDDGINSTPDDSTGGTVLESPVISMDDQFPTGNGPDKPNGSLVSNRRVLHDDSQWTSQTLTAVVGGGEYIRYWFNNCTSDTAFVTLLGSNSTSADSFKAIDFRPLIVPGNTDNLCAVYRDETHYRYYKIQIECHRSRTIDGYYNVAQYRYDPGEKRR